MEKREALFISAREELNKALAPFGERILDTPVKSISESNSFANLNYFFFNLKRNRVSIGITLESIPLEDVTFIGAQLFQRNVSGARAIE